MKKTDEVMIDLYVHWKQGDDFASSLEACDGKVVAGLRAWADGLSGSAERIREVAAILEGASVEGFGGTHCVSISGVPARLLEKLEATGIVHRSAFDEDEDGDEDGDEDWDRDDGDEAGGDVS